MIVGELIPRVLDGLPFRAQPGYIKCPGTFGLYVKERITRMMTCVFASFSAPTNALETFLADRAKTKPMYDWAMDGQDWLAQVLRYCFSSSVLAKLLEADGYADVVEVTAATLESWFRPLFKKAKREQRILLRHELFKPTCPDGICAMAKHLTSALSDAVHLTLCQVDVVSIGSTCWSSRRSPTLCEPVRLVERSPSPPRRVDRTIRMEDQRRSWKRGTSKCVGHDFSLC